MLVPVISDGGVHTQQQNLTVAMSDSSEDESRMNAILSDDIVNGTRRSEHTTPNVNSRKRNYVCEKSEETQNEKLPENMCSAFSLKNAYCIIINNVSFNTEDLEKYYDRKILDLRRFLEQIARFSTVKVYQNLAGESFLRIFEDVTHNPYLEGYDGFLCFVLCDNEATKSLKCNTPGNMDIHGAASVITKSPHLNMKPKLFFVQELATTDTKVVSTGHNNPPIEGGNEFLFAHEISVFGSEGLIPRLLESFREFADRENILAMLAKCSYSTIHTQVYNLSKPVVFANCYGKPKHKP